MASAQVSILPNGWGGGDRWDGTGDILPEMSHVGHGIMVLRWCLWPQMHCLSLDVNSSLQGGMMDVMGQGDILVELANIRKIFEVHRHVLFL